MCVIFCFQSHLCTYIHISTLMYTYGTGFQFPVQHIIEDGFPDPYVQFVLAILCSISMSLSLFCSCLLFSCSHYQIIVVAIPPGQTFDVTANPADMYGPDFRYNRYSDVSVLGPAVGVPVCLVYLCVWCTL